ncbi:MAG: methyltransferase domain-containing protein [Candidatus Hodarchaeales archaeon]|jgi:ubiquinone/menaquinone biosynthesis C-methylase UbiE
MVKPTERFSDRVKNYIKFRPSYPNEIIKILERETNFTKDCIVADVGSGTGILSELFLSLGNQVYCIEPNNEMRNAAEELLNQYSNFRSIDGTAEKTNLNNNSIEIIVSGQAFHWFNIPMAKQEFKRILKPNSSVILMWNSRKKSGTQFSKEYEKLINNYSDDYKKVAHYNLKETDIKTFFKEESYKTFELKNKQIFSFNGLKGRLFSSSYMPNESSEYYSNIVTDLRKIFNKYSENDEVIFEYRTEIHLGKLD